MGNAGGYHPRMADIDLTPTEEMASNAARGLELREKHGRGGTAVGVARARDIKNRKNLSPDTVRRMHSFFSRHAGNEAGGEDDAGYISFLLWGGAAGRSWAKRKSAQLDKDENAMSDTRKEIMERLGNLMSRPGAKAKMAKYRAFVYRGSPRSNVLVKATEWMDSASAAEDAAKQIAMSFRGKPGYNSNDYFADIAQETPEGAKTVKNNVRFSRPGAKAKFAEDAREVAQEILRQLGGGRFMAMVGGKNAFHGTFGGKAGLQFDIGKGADGGVNRVIVKLDRGTDTYDMEFWRIGNRGMNVKKVSEASGVYADDLQRIFTSRTKFYTSLSRPGAKAKMAKPQFRVRKLHGGYLAVDMNQGSGWERYDTTHEEVFDGLEDYERGYQKAYDRGLRWSGGSWRIPSTKASRPGAKAKMGGMRGIGDWAVSFTNIIVERLPELRKLARDLKASIKVSSPSPNGYVSGTITRKYGSSEAPDLMASGKVKSMIQSLGGQLDSRLAGFSRPGAKAHNAADILKVEVMDGSTVTSSMTPSDFMAYAKRSLPGIASTSSLPDMIARFNELAEEKGMRVRVRSNLAKSKNAIREGEKVSASDDAVSRKIRKLMDEGKPQKQAVAIALDLERRGEL